MGIVSPNMLDMENFDSMNGTAGTGPYIYDSFDTGANAAVFIKNTDYWGDGAAYDKIVVRNIADANACLMALQSGEVDMIFGSDWISYDDYEQAITMSGVKGKVSENDVRTRVVVLNASSAALSDKAVRQAVTYAVDKQTIVDSFMHGHETVTDHSLSESLPYCDLTLNTKQSYDLSRAKALLDEAGWGDSDGDGIRDKDGTALKLTFRYPRTPNWRRLSRPR